MVKLGISDEEFERQYAAAVQRGKESLKTEPRAAHAEYDAASRRILIDLLDGCTFIVPVDLMQGLRGATDEELKDFELMPLGFDLHWKTLDAQFTIAGLLAGRFGNKAWMAKLQPSRKRSAYVVKRSSKSANGGKATRSRLSPAQSKANNRRNSAA